MPPDPNWALLLLLLVSVAASSSVAATSNGTATSPACGPDTCRNSSSPVKVGYPFWLHTPNASASYCGYAGLGLTCSSGGPTFHTQYGDYAILGINSTARTVSLADAAMLAGDPTCPSPRNVSSDLLYDMELLDSYVNLTFYLNCAFYDSDPAPNPIPCLSPPYPTQYSYVFRPGDSSAALTGAYCKDTVVVPVKKSSIPASAAVAGNESNWFADVLRRGFEMRWGESVMKDCKDCERSGGQCLYNNATSSGLIFDCLCDDGSHDSNCSARGGAAAHSKGESRNLSKLIIIGIIIGALLIGGICFLFFLKGKCHTMFCLCHRIWDDSKTIEVFLEEYTLLALQRFTYIELRNITKSFKEKLGQGGYGRVFKGKLKDGRLVAVKLLNDSGTNGQEFMNEVASIGRTNHVNIVNLLGFCSEGTKRALVYEFMPNGSLEKFLSLNNSGITQSLQWEDLYKIAVGIAMGLEYLHKGCTTRVVHFDIKPHNILLDDNLNPKISDFGLAKLCPSKESILSMNIPRGTVGYIAPEVFSRNFGVVSSKSDVYSYGMLLLEIVGLRKKKNVGIQDTETSIYFPHWIYEQFDQNGDFNFYDITTNDLDHELVKKLILIGLWCIQTYPAKRPSISKVIEMLDGKYEDLEMPPKPYICSPTRSSMEFDSTTMC